MCKPHMTSHIRKEPLKFIEDHASKWERVVVYDIQTKGGWAGKLDV